MKEKKKARFRIHIRIHNNLLHCFFFSLTSLPFPFAKSTFFQFDLAVLNTSRFSSYISVNLSTSFVHYSEVDEFNTWRIPVKKAERTCKLCIARRACADISWVCKSWWMYARVKWGLYWGLDPGSLFERVLTPRHIQVRVDGDIGEHAAHEQIGRWSSMSEAAPWKTFARGLKSRLNFESYRL